MSKDQNLSKKNTLVYVKSTNDDVSEGNTQVHHKMSHLSADKIAERHKIGRRYIREEGESGLKHSENLRGSGNYSGI